MLPFVAGLVNLVENCCLNARLLHKFVIFASLFVTLPMRAVNKEVRSLLLNQDKTNEKIIIPACCGSRSDGCGEHPTKMNVTMRSGDVITYQIADIDSIWFSGESTTPTPVAAENNGPDVIYAPR